MCGCSGVSPAEGGGDVPKICLLTSDRKEEEDEAHVGMFAKRSLFAQM